MHLPWDNWRLKLIAAAGSKMKWSLMAWWDSDYYTPEHYDNPVNSHFVMYPDAWFIAPTSLVRAYENALATVQFLEANLEAYRQKSAHRKTFIDYD